MKIDKKKLMENTATPETNPAQEIQTTFTVEEIQELLPHRYPFALVDRIIDYVPGEKAVGLKKCDHQ